MCVCVFRIYIYICMYVCMYVHRRAHSHRPRTSIKHHDHYSRRVHTDAYTYTYMIIYVWGECVCVRVCEREHGSRLAAAFVH